MSWFLSVEVCTISASWKTGEVELVEQSGTGDVNTRAAAISPSSSTRPITLDVAKLDQLHRSEEDFYFQVRLSVLFITALSGISNSTRLQYTCSGKKTAWTFTVRLYGYGYDTKTVSVQLTMTVITAYCVIILVYIAYTFITGTTSTAWNSAIELVVLALQSKRPDHLGNIAVGLDSIQTFKEGVGIRVNKDNELELVFAHDRDIDKRGLRKIEPNKEY